MECETCGRRFLPEALEKHARICQKVFASKRKPFNMAKQRLAGTEAQVGGAGCMCLLWPVGRVALLCCDIHAALFAVALLLAAWCSWQASHAHAHS